MSDKQWNFLLDVAELIMYADQHGIKMTGGELYRTAYQHAENQRLGLTKAVRSKHMDRLAIDFNLWYEDKVMWSMSKDEILTHFKFLGEFWESLREGNRWGGHWPTFFDPAHFQGP
jgi:hypothetical protein